MQKTNLTILLISILLLVSPKNHILAQDTVNLTGEVENYNGKNAELYLLLQQPGAKNVRKPLQIDKEGNFSIDFNTNSTYDGMILDRKTFANIYFIYHPGDSIHINLSAKKNETLVLKSVEFSGNGANTNNTITQFEILRESNNLGYGALNPEEMRNISEDDITRKMLGIKQQQLDIFNTFKTENVLSPEALIWITEYATQTYYYFMWEYSISNKVSKSYHDYNKDLLPLSKEKLVCWSIVKNRVMTYRSDIVEENISAVKKKAILLKKNPDQAFFDMLYKSCNDSLFNQLCIADKYRRDFEGLITDDYEKNENSIKLTNKHIYLNVLSNYKQTVQRVNKPITLDDLTVNMVDKKDNNNNVIDKIISDNQGKVIYLDCWATWCAPCRKAMPYSKKLMSKFSTEDVAFVFVCIDSDEKTHKVLISELGIEEGKHYYLNKERSKHFRNKLEIQGIPSYFLINKKGEVVNQGLHPNSKTTENEINELINR